MSNPPLTVHNAEIKTASVEVRTLTISGKQVTLAVFRQLREEPLIAYDGTLNGVPWGVVNYHPDKCAEGSRHWHVVWQRDNELLRSRLYEEAVLGGSEYQCLLGLIETVLEASSPEDGERRLFWVGRQMYEHGARSKMSVTHLGRWEGALFDAATMRGVSEEVVSMTLGAAREEEPFLIQCRKAVVSGLPQLFIAV